MWNRNATATNVNMRSSVDSVNSCWRKDTLLQVPPWQKCKEKCLTERYFVSCTAPAEISVCVSVSAVGNVDVADYNISDHIVLVWLGSFNSNVTAMYLPVRVSTSRSCRTVTLRPSSRHTHLPSVVQAQLTESSDRAFFRTEARFGASLSSRWVHRTLKKPSWQIL